MTEDKLTQLRAHATVLRELLLARALLSPLAREVLSDLEPIFQEIFAAEALRRYELPGRSRYYSLDSPLFDDEELAEAYAQFAVRAKGMDLESTRQQAEELLRGLGRK